MYSKEKEQQLEMGLILEKHFIENLFPKYFGHRSTIKKHEDEYNPVDFIAKNKITQIEKTGQLKVIVPTRKYREISISDKHRKDYEKSNVDVLFHLSTVKYEDEYGLEPVDIELRFIKFSDIKFIKKTTDIGTRWHIPLKGMTVVKLDETDQRYLDGMYDKMVRPYENPKYRSKKKF